MVLHLLWESMSSPIFSKNRPLKDGFFCYLLPCCFVPGTTCQVPDERCQSAGCRLSNNTVPSPSGCWSHVPGSWLLVAGCWFLVPGSWFLVAGSWFLVPGSWLTPSLSRAFVHSCSRAFAFLSHRPIAQSPQIPTFLNS